MEPRTSGLESKDLVYLLLPHHFHSLPPNLAPPHTVPHTTPASKLLQTGHFAAAAVAAAIALTSFPPPSDNQTIISLWQTRLQSLILLGLHSSASQELKAFQEDVFTSPLYRDSNTNRSVLPWDFRVLTARLYVVTTADWRRCIGLYYELATEARTAAAAASKDVKQREFWLLRLQGLGIRVANALIELGDPETASRHLESMLTPSFMSETLPESKNMFALVCMRAGMTEAARKFVGEDHGDAVVEALEFMAASEWRRAEESWARLRPDGSVAGPFDDIVTCNEVVCLLYQRKPAEVSPPSPPFAHLSPPTELKKGCKNHSIKDRKH
jgi:hypothetical protein